MNSQAANAAAEGSVSASARRAPGASTTAYGSSASSSLVSLTGPPLRHQPRHLVRGRLLAAGDGAFGFADASHGSRIGQELYGGLERREILS